MGELEDAVILSQILFVVKDKLQFAANQGRAGPARTAAGRAACGAAQTEAADITGSLICVGKESVYRKGPMEEAGLLFNTLRREYDVLLTSLRCVI